MKIRIYLSMVVSIAIMGFISPVLAGTIMEEYFTGGKMHQLESQSCCWDVIGYENGYLLRQNKTDGYDTIVTTKGKYNSFTVETRVRYANPDLPTYTDNEQTKKGFAVPRMGAGLLFGFLNDKNFYLFRFAGEDKVVFGKLVNGEWKEINSESGIRNINLNEAKTPSQVPWGTLRVIINKNDTVSCYYNDNFLFSHPCSNLGDHVTCSGKVGLTTFKAMADFQYLKIWSGSHKEGGM